MSDAHHEHHHDEHGGGGHEVDQMPNARLFNLLFGLSALTFVACFGVVQLFNRQVDSIEADRAKAGSYSRHAYAQEMERHVDAFGQATIRDGDREITLYHVPVDKAVEQVLANPKAFQRGRLYPGWAQTPTALAVKDAERQFAPTPAAPTLPQVQPPEQPAAPAGGGAQGNPRPSAGQGAPAVPAPEAADSGGAAK